MGFGVALVFHSSPRSSQSSPKTQQSRGDLIHFADKDMEATSCLPVGSAVKAQVRTCLNTLPHFKTLPHLHPALGLVV